MSRAVSRTPAGAVADGPAHCPIPWSAELLALGQRYGPRLAVRDAHGELSYAALSRRAHALADWLRSVSPNGNGLRVGVLLHNGRAAVLADYGIAAAGGCIVHLNPAYSAQELAWCLRIAPVDLLLTEPALAGRTAGLDVPVHGFPDDAVLDARPAPPAPLPAADPAGPGRILFTSGTSGPPKAVVYSHYKRWLAATVLRAVLPYRPDGSGVLLMTPYVHGASMLARAYLDCGGWTTLLGGARIPEVEAALREPGLAAMFAPPSVLAKLADAFAGRSYPMRCVYSGTQPLSAALFRRAAAVFGPALRVTYGKSENLNPITVLDADDCAALYGAAEGEPAGCCVGRAGPGVEVRIADDGEVLLRSQHMFDGYLTAQGWQPHPPAAWHGSGDVGRVDEAGRLWLTGRKNQIINTGGYKINPDEVAAVIRAAPGVADAMVVGVASEYWTEIPVCGYVPAAGAAPDEAALRRAVGHLTSYKQPRLYVPLAAIPVNAMGKPSAQGLRDYIAAAYRLQDGPHPELHARERA